MLAIKTRNDIDIKKVLLNIGYEAGHKLPARIITLVSDYIEHASYIFDPSYSYVIRDIESVHGTQVTIEGAITLESEVIARLLENCKKAAIFLTTIGVHLEDTVNQLAEDGLILQASVLDAIGSGAAERLAILVQNMVEKEARAQGLYISQRFSPGYCDWNVKQQKMVFKAMNGDSAGIQLTEECLMLPRKSISGIIGIGPREINDYNPCKTCDRLECVGRRYTPKK